MSPYIRITLSVEVVKHPGHCLSISLHWTRNAFRCSLHLAHTIMLLFLVTWLRLWEFNRRYLTADWQIKKLKHWIDYSFCISLNSHGLGLNSWSYFFSTFLNQKHTLNRSVTSMYFSSRGGVQPTRTYSSDPCKIKSELLLIFMITLPNIGKLWHLYPLDALCNVMKESLRGYMP